MVDGLFPTSEHCCECGEWAICHIDVMGVCLHRTNRVLLTPKPACAVESHLASFTGVLCLTIVLSRSRVVDPVLRAIGCIPLVDCESWVLAANGACM